MIIQPLNMKIYQATHKNSQKVRSRALKTGYGVSSKCKSFQRR